jgi:hypothetical protein
LAMGIKYLPAFVLPAVFWNGMKFAHPTGSINLTHIESPKPLREV